MSDPWDYLFFCALVVFSFSMEILWLRQHQVPWMYFLPSGIAFTLILGVGYFLAERSGNREREQVMNSLKGIAPTYAGEIERMGHSQVGLDSSESATYLNIIDAQKRWVKSNPNIADIYTIRKQGPDFVFIVDSETDYDGDGAFGNERESRTLIGEKVASQQSSTEALALAFNGRDTFDPNVYSDRWGMWVTAYSPLRDEQGHVEAVLGIDYPARSFLNRINASRLNIILLLGLVALMLLSFTAVYILQKIQVWQIQRTTTSLETLHREIEVRTRAEQAAKESEERYRLLVENVPTVVWAALESGKLRFVSPNVQPILGFTSEEICNEDSANWFKRIHEDEAESVRAKLIVLFQEGEPFELDCRIQKKDGNYIWIRMHAAAPEQRGTEWVSCGVLSDITAHRELDRRMQCAQRMETVGCLAGGVAHDFNNLLTSIIGLSELIRMSLNPNSADARHLAQIIEVAKRGGDLTQQLLAFSRKKFVRPEVLNLSTTVTEMEPLLRQLSGEDVEFFFKPEANLRHVSIDASSLEQIIVNVVVNAKHAMPNGGTLTIVTSNLDLLGGDQPAGVLDIAPGPYVILEISDSGIGMCEEVQARIFEPFFTTKPIGKGTGLGLAMCHGIVKQAKGTIAVVSEPGKGTTIRIILPQAAAMILPAPVVAAHPTSKGGNETVLLVEDDPLILRCTQRMLEILGYTILIACDGVEALKLVEGTGQNIDIMVTDIVMPRMGGIELAEIIKARYPKIKILFASGYSGNDFNRLAKIGGCQNMIQKPYTPEVLDASIRAMLR